MIECYAYDFSHQPLCLQFFIKILLYYFKNNPLNFSTFHSDLSLFSLRLSLCLDLDNHHCQAAEQISYYHILRCVNTSVVLGPGDLLLSGDGLALPTVNPVTVTAVKPGETDEKRMPTTFTGNFILYFYNLVDIPGCYQLSYPDD